jgi:hypothetical protein
MSKKENILVWTEALGCAEILNPMISSYLAHHTEVLHVFVYEEEAPLVNTHKQIILELISDRKESYVKKQDLKVAYQSGHLGTALLWKSIIERNEKALLIHLDADTIFVSNVTDLLLEKIEGFGIVGSRRPYRRNKAFFGIRKWLLKLRPDAVNTHCFIFRSEAVKFSGHKLIKAITGLNRNSFQKIFLPVIDFFDLVTFHISKHNGVYYLDSSDQSGSGNHDRFGDFEKRMISFAAVGSGCNFFKNPAAHTSASYKNFALASFSLYSKMLLDREIGVTPLESPDLMRQLENLDKSTWTIRESKV